MQIYKQDSFKHSSMCINTIKNPKYFHNSVSTILTSFNSIIKNHLLLKYPITQEEIDFFNYSGLMNENFFSLFHLDDFLKKGDESLLLNEEKKSYDYSLFIKSFDLAFPPEQNILNFHNFETISQLPFQQSNNNDILYAFSAWYVINDFESHSTEFPTFICWLIEKSNEFLNQDLLYSKQYFHLLLLGIIRFFTPDIIFLLTSDEIDKYSAVLFTIFKFLQSDNSFALILYFMKQSSRFTGTIRLHSKEIIDELISNSKISNFLITDFILILLKQPILSSNELKMLYTFFEDRIIYNELISYDFFLCCFYFFQASFESSLPVDKLIESIETIISTIPNLPYQIKDKFYRILFVEKDPMIQNNSIIVDHIEPIIQNFLEDLEDSVYEMVSLSGLAKFLKVMYRQNKFGSVVLQWLKNVIDQKSDVINLESYKSIFEFYLFLLDIEKDFQEPYQIMIEIMIEKINENYMYSSQTKITSS